MYLPFRAALVAFCLLLWLPGFFTLPPGDRDESRFAQATKQMNETGDYVRILNGTEPRNRKPIGIHWLQAPFAGLAGPNLANPIWPYRIPSLLGGLLAVLATFEAGLVLTTGAAVAAAAAAMLAASVLLTSETHIAKTDAALLGVTTLAMAMLARAWVRERLSPWQAGVFWLAAAAGILLKGPVAPMVLVLAAGTLSVWERDAHWLRPLRSQWGVPLMVAAASPWFVAIDIATNGAFFTEAIGHDLGGKLAGVAEAHGAPPGLHLLLLPLLAFPATLPVLAGLQAAWTTRHRSATRFLIAWALPAWLVFEAVPTKLPHYTLPLYPALFLMAANALDRTWPRWIVLAGRGLVVLAAGLLATAAIAVPIWLHGPWWLGIPGAAFAGLAAVFAWQRRTAWALCSAIPLYASVLQMELPSIPPLWIGPRTAEALRQDWPGWNRQGRGLVVAGYAEPSLVFLTGTQTRLLPDGSQAAAALKDGTSTMAVVAQQEMDRFEYRAHQLGMAPRLLAGIDGFNPSRGRWVRLNLMAR